MSEPTITAAAIAAPPLARWKSAAAILRGTRDLLTPETWIEGMSRGVHVAGKIREASAANADSWCAIGAMAACAEKAHADAAAAGLAHLLLRETIGAGSIEDWNDAAERTLPELHAKIDAAIALADAGPEVRIVGDRERADVGIAGTLTGGNRSTLTGGNRSTLTGGNRSTLTGGNRSTLTGGNRSTLTGGDDSTLTGGYASTLTGGYASTLTGGDDSTLTGGYASTLTGGDASTLTGGDDSTLTGGYASTLTGGNRSTLTGGYASTLTGGDDSTLTGGYASTLTGGDRSTLCVRWWDGNRYRIAAFEVGENGVEAGVAYRCEGGKIVRVDAKAEG